MTQRKWFCDQKTFEWTDEMASEARTRSITFTTYPTLTDDKGYYVFTEEELKNVVKAAWISGMVEADKRRTRYEGVDIDAEDYWQQKFGGGE